MALSFLGPSGCIMFSDTNVIRGDTGLVYTPGPSGSLLLQGDLLTTGTGTYNLGSIEHPWGSIYSSIATLYMGQTAQFGADQNGIAYTTLGFATPFINIGPIKDVLDPGQIGGWEVGPTGSPTGPDYDLVAQQKLPSFGLTGPIYSLIKRVGPTGPTGPAGSNGSSSSYYDYQADNSATPITGHISWSNFASQISSTYIRVNHINKNGDDIDIFLNLVKQGNQLIIQDADVSANYQTWLVSGTPIPNTGSGYVQYPVTSVGFGGTTNFNNNHNIILAVISSAVSGPTGPTGPASTVTGPTGPASRVTGSWTLTTGPTGVSFTVPPNGTYSLWVRGNIPNGIIVYTATVAVTNSNVPVVGTSYAWNYTGGGSPLLLTSIPDQIVGTPNSISTATTGTSPTNTFTFGINNTSGSSQVVDYGYTIL